MKKCTVAILGPRITDWHLSCWKVPISMLLTGGYGHGSFRFLSVVPRSASIVSPGWSMRRLALIARLSPTRLTTSRRPACLRVAALGVLNHEDHQESDD